MRNAGGEREFGPAEHREGAVLADIAPGEVDKSGSGPAVDCCAAQIQPGLAGDNLDRDRPRRCLGVGGHQLAWLFAP
jgi:hypothetical protein